MKPAQPYGFLCFVDLLLHSMQFASGFADSKMHLEGVWHILIQQVRVDSKQRDGRKSGSAAADVTYIADMHIVAQGVSSP